MKTIRVKNKHLLLAVLVALLAMGAVRHYGPDFLWHQAQQAYREGDRVKALAYYDALIERYPHHHRRPEALYWSAELLPGFEDFAASFFPGGSTVVQRGLATQGLPEGALSKVERYLLIQEECPDHWTASHVHFKLADAYHAMGDPRAEELYLQTLHKNRATNRWEAGLRLAQIYESQGRVEEALEILNYCRYNLHGQMNIEGQIKLGDLLVAAGDTAGAQEAYEQALVQARSIRENFPPEMDEDDYARFSVVAEYERRIGPRLASLEQPGSSVYVQGQVSLLGRPLAGVHVYVRSAADGGAAFPTRLDSPGQWITDENGRFAGLLPPGSYEFGISLNFHQAELAEGTHLQIHGGRQELEPGSEPQPIEFRFVETVKLKSPARDAVYTGGPVEVEWEPYPGAKEYQLWFGVVSLNGLGGSRSSSVPVDVTRDTKYVLAERSVVPFGAVGVDPQGVEPGSLVMRPEAFDRLLVSVYALDEAGQVLSSSAGLRFGSEELVPGEIPVQEGLRTEAEELLFQRNYDEAVELLERQLAENPEDVNTLWLLARIYYTGTYGQGENAWDHRQFAHRNLSKSLELLQRIQALQPGPEVEAALQAVQAGLIR